MQQAVSTLLTETGEPRNETMTRDIRLKRLRFRAHHRGTKEADIMVGNFFDRYCNTWDDAQIAWFEALMEEQDADIMAWATCSAPVPERAAGNLMTAMQRLDYIKVER